jgi:UDP:flavonoid glycosyltransferase YjiC (YdhE family)
MARVLAVAEVVPREEASPAAIGEAVTRVLDDDEMREKAEHHAARLQLTDPPGVAAGLVEGLL